MALLTKPHGCEGCPFQGDGQGFVPDEIKPGAKVLLVFQNPGKDEEAGQRLVSKNPYVIEPAQNAPLLGATGLSLGEDFLPLAGLSRSEVNLANVLRCRYQHKNDLPTNPALTKQAILHCQRYNQIPGNTVLIVASGEWALWGMTQEGLTGKEDEDKGRSLSAWRGYLLPYNPPPRPQIIPTDIFMPSGSGEPPVFATYHVAHQWNQPEMWPVMRRDWQKVGEILAGKWPQPLPPISLEPPTTWPRLSAFDTEFGEKDGHLLRYSLAYTERHGASKVHVVEASLAWEVPTSPQSVVYAHNIPADIGFLNNTTGGVPLRVEDTMLQHSVLWSDLPHPLNFVGSIYSRLNRWKHLDRSNPIVYSAGDAVGTLDAGCNLTKELQRDPRAEKVYRDYRLPLWAIISKAQQKGAKVSAKVIDKAVAELTLTMDDAQALARAATGWNINLGSAQQVIHWLYDIEQINQKNGRAIGFPRLKFK